KEVLQFLEPDYDIPSWRTITARIELQHESSVSKLKSTLATVDFVAITSDSWTAFTTESYVTITCHFIADTKVNGYVLQTRAMEERHSAANLADYLKTSVEQWGLDGKHDRLKCTQSAADMLVRLHEQSWAITAMLSDRTVTKLADAKTLELIDDHWQTIEEMLPVLQSLKTASEALGGENYVSVSMVYPLVQSLLCRHLQICHGESQKVTEFRNRCCCISQATNKHR
ncbi:zinc finger BED domain-containing protein 1-like, partial [Tachysurus ichikawai]